MADLDISNVIDSMANDAKKRLSKKTNADKIRSMTNKEMSTDLIPLIMEVCEDGVPCEELFLEWLQSEAEQEREWKFLK